jgi:hypothetical protein
VAPSPPDAAKIAIHPKLFVVPNDESWWVGKAAPSEVEGEAESPTERRSDAVFGPPSGSALPPNRFSRSFSDVVRSKWVPPGTPIPSSSLGRKRLVSFLLPEAIAVFRKDDAPGVLLGCPSGPVSKAQRSPLSPSRYF